MSGLWTFILVFCGTSGVIRGLLYGEPAWPVTNWDYPMIAAWTLSIWMATVGLARWQRSEISRLKLLGIALALTAAGSFARKYQDTPSKWQCEQALEHWRERAVSEERSKVYLTAFDRNYNKTLARCRDGNLDGLRCVLKADSLRGILQCR